MARHWPGYHARMPPSPFLDRLTLGRLRNFGRVEAMLLLLSILGSVGYVATRWTGPPPAAIVLKALSIAPLAVLAFRILGGVDGARGHGRVSLAGALTLSSIGDVLLAIDRRRYFLLALGVFLLAHLAYIGLFVRSWPRPLRPSGRQLALAAGVTAYGLLLTTWLAPGLGSYTVPVIVYAGAIVAMTVSAVLASFSRPFIVIGALLFLVSDSLIAVARFKAGWIATGYLIWPAYYLGQYGIAVGFLREQAGDIGDHRDGPEANS